MVGTQILVPGSSPVVIGGSTYSIASTGVTIIVNGATEYLLGNNNLKAGGSVITVSGTMTSLQAEGQTVVVGGTTEAVSVFLTQNSVLVGLLSST